METILFGYFFRAPAKFKLQKRKKIKKRKGLELVYKTGMNEVNTSV